MSKLILRISISILLGSVLLGLWISADPSLQLIAKIPSTDLTVLLSCADCDLAPVDKRHHLPAEYESTDLVQIPKYETTQRRLRAQAWEALERMIAAAAAADLDIYIVSAYRSYDDQAKVFAGWVDSEQDQGYSFLEAVERASSYSARPGHSEHQLGTAVDLMCASCKPFENSTDNQEIYDFITENAHKYGYVVSYPPETEELTGYIAEPWHIRYVGVEIATELYERNYLSGSGDYIWRYLFALWQIKP
jgi:zinc D-Ala-D-Ala carboxypeptidase